MAFNKIKVLQKKKKKCENELVHLAKSRLGIGIKCRVA